jgi:hypothetical protein
MTGNKKSQRIVVITGAGRGIGRSIALEFSREGAIVIVAEINATNGLAVKTEIESMGGVALFVQTDVSNVLQVKSLMKTVGNEFGHIDVLINNAGLSEFYDPLEISEETWDRILGTNLKGVFFCSREAAKRMKVTGGGAIINIASTRATMSEPNSEAYAASKGGILALTHALAASFSKYNITVNAILPGWIETGNYSALRQIDHSQHFSNRVGKPEDIARACLFLTSPENNFITGSHLVIDGGMTRKMIYKE